MITHRELKNIAYNGCRCKWCFNKEWLKRSFDVRRAVLKRDTIKEVKNHNSHYGFYLLFRRTYDIIII